MKKYLCLALCLALLICVSGCGCESETTSPTGETQPDTAGNISEFVISNSATDDVFILEAGDAELISLDGISEEEMQNVQWTSNNEKVASVDDAGRVDALSVGVAEITVKYKEQEITCNIKVIKNEDDEKRYSTAIVANQSILENKDRKSTRLNSSH